ncbi:MAG: DUF4878 domain-containing protein [Firmicutes bacterium]|nr:DUF4878 domain-containing protein [Bacillota bacterium]
MKKILALLLVFSLVFGMAACSSGPKPEDTVKKFFDAMKAFDFETMSACCEDGFDAEDMLSEEEEDLTGLLDYLKENAKGLTYKIGSSEVKDDKAKVDVSVEYTDTSQVVGEALGTYITALFTAMFSEDASEEELEKAFTEGLANAIETKETTRLTEDYTLDLVLSGEEWKLTNVPEEMANVMMGNLTHAFDNLEDLFGGDDSDWSLGGEAVEYPISDTVLLDNDDVTVTVQGGGADEWGNINFSVLCENKTDKDLTFRLEDLVVNGWYVGGSLYQDVAAGKSAVGDLDIWASDMETIGLENPDKVTAQVQVYNEEEWWDDIYMVDEPVTFYPTELADSDITVPERPAASDEIVLADDDNFTMILVDNGTGEWGGFNIRAYIKNKTDKPIYVDWEDVSMNGFMIDPYCGMTIPAGQQAMNEISFAVNEMEEAGIETVENIEFTLQVSDDTTGEELFNKAMTYEP